MFTLVVILVVDVIFVLVRTVVVWLIGLIGREPKDFSETVTGMISSGDEDDIEAGVGVFGYVKKHIVIVLFVANGIVALIVGFAVSYVEHHNAHPVLVHIDPSPTTTQTPIPSPTPSSCAT